MIADELESVENTAEGASSGSYYPSNAGNGGGPYRYHRTNVRERKRMMRCVLLYQKSCKKITQIQFIQL